MMAHLKEIFKLIQLMAYITNALAREEVIYRVSLSEHLTLHCKNGYR